MNQTQLKLERYSLQIKDIPSGWVFDGENWSHEFGGDTYVVAYKVKGVNSVGIGHSITIYSTDEQVEQAFKRFREEWFSSTEYWPEAKFEPTQERDEYIYECLELHLETSLISCSFLQRHDKFIVYVLATFNNHYMTLSQLNQILKTLDERLNRTSFD